MQLKRDFIFLVLSLPSALAILNGQNESLRRGNHGFVVSIQDNQRRHFCGGALYGDRFVLTAATCVYNKEPTHLLVFGNSINLDKRGKFLSIDRIISKTATGKNEVNNNIALLRLSERYNPTEFFCPIDIPKFEEQADAEDEQGFFYGWGQTSIEDEGHSQILQWSMAEIAPLDACRKYNGDVDESNICIFYDRRLCKLDTGDPLIGNNYFYGTVLWGIATKQFVCKEETRDRGDVYTRIYSHKDWIEKTVEENSDLHSSSKSKSQTTAIRILALLVTVFYRK